mgnify:CR=1 FL=1
MMNLVLVEEKEMVDEYGVHCERKEYEIGNYKVTVDWEDGKLDDIFVREDFNVEYVAEISLKGRHSWNGPLRFEIQTAAYGSKEVDDIQKIIKGYQQAIEVVEILTKKFL